MAPYRQAVHDSLLQRDTSLPGLTNRLWRALSFGDTGFDRRERLAQQVLAVTADDLRQTWPALLESATLAVTYDPGDEPSNTAELTRHLEPMPPASD